MSETNGQENLEREERSSNRGDRDAAAGRADRHVGGPVRRL
jgi:hypothetical protein